MKKYVAKEVRNVFIKIGLVLPESMSTIFSGYVSFWFFLMALYTVTLKLSINKTYPIIWKFFYGIFAFSIVILVALIISRLFRNYIHEKIGSNIIKFSIIFIGLILILNQAGIKLTPIFTALGISSAAIALALQDTLANFFAGINILANKRISKNDYIKIDSGYEGTVIELNWRTTLIREISNAIIIVPNSKISSSIVTSFQYQRSEIMTSIRCGVAYGSNLDHVEKVAKMATQEVIDKYENFIKTYTPTVRFTGFSDSSINFALFFKIKDIYSKIYLQSEVLKNLYKKFNEERIEIPFPQMVVKLANKQENINILEKQIRGVA
ncbi:MAG: mechanosensitive ion channel family protein [Endomicrobium sp.]|nr:mechanosensitive ion channel family protein [Endomicrobium sp.]